MTDAEVLAEAFADGFELEDRVVAGPWVWRWCRGTTPAGCATSNVATHSGDGRSAAARGVLSLTYINRSIDLDVLHAAAPLLPGPRRAHRTGPDGYDPPT